MSPATLGVGGAIPRAVPSEAAEGGAATILAALATLEREGKEGFNEFDDGVSELLVSSFVAVLLDLLLLLRRTLSNAATGSCLKIGIKFFKHLF